MKKSKRLISLILAVVMVLSFMAMSASAATTEVQPRGTCPQCINGYMEYTIGSYTRETRSQQMYYNCQNIGVGHYHYFRYFPVPRTQCRNCGYSNPFSPITKEYCPYNGYVS